MVFIFIHFAVVVAVVVVAVVKLLHDTCRANIWFFAFVAGAFNVLHIM